ncbi:DUF1566 domain-containing protein [Pseudoalteromonas luteoviolacea]|uniref:DUF1566 domain-containing protein n=1 Tax=Pseudoalteromonas luteoviolacea TaxID=43657 RepID=UPI001F43C172|nr:DUF1566 domain-containing protein [Pseudoalteromonas luteoviolacea]MCF6440587.1 DUF1566 domain-containing protein [Pseudoalteromonas luteoviolacea]
MFKKLLKPFLIIGLSTFINACGGGGGGDNNASPSTPSKPKNTEYDVSVDIVGSGQVYPIKSQVKAGESISLSISNDEGQELIGITGCGGRLENNNYIISDVTSSCVVSAEFAIKPIQITTVINGEGTILPSSPILDWGTSQDFSIQAMQGFELSGVTGCAGVLEGEVYSVQGVKSDCEIRVDFIPKNVVLEAPGLDQTIEVRVKGNGALASSSQGVIKPGEDGAPPIPKDIELPFLVNDIDIKVGEGETVEFEIVYEEALPDGTKYFKFGPKEPGAEDTWYELPSQLYSISQDRKVISLTLTDGQLGDADWEVNGLIQDPGGPAIAKTYSVGVQISEGGSITQTQFEVLPNESVSFDVTVYPGYQIDNVQGCSASLAGSTVTTGVITEDCNISVDLSLQSFLVQMTSNDGGQIEPASLQVPYLEEAVFSILPNEGYRVENISGCGGVLNGNTYTTSPVTQDCQAAIIFERNVLTVSTVASEGGALTPDSLQVNYADSAEINIFAEPGYKLVQIEGCNGQLSGNVYRTEALTDHCTVSAQFEKVAFEVIANAGTGGSILPAMQNVVFGEMATFEVSAERGYEIVSVQGCEGSLFGNTFMTSEITNHCDIEALFSIQNLTVTTTHNEGGELTPSAQTVAYGETVSIDVITEAGYKIQSVTGCGGLLNGSVYTTDSLISDCQIRAKFEPIQYTVSASATVGGSITPSSQQVVFGNSAVFEIKPDIGYEISDVSGCGGRLTGTTYITGSISQSCSVSASFSQKTYTVNSVASAGGQISPPNQVVVHGQTAQFEVSVDAGHSLVAVEGCGGTLNGNIFTTGPITANCQVNANFNIDSYIVSATSGVGGAISPGSKIVEHGKTVSFTVSTKEGYSLSTVSGCNGSLNGSIFTTSAITQNCSVKAEFTLNRYTLSSAANEGGSISPATQIVAHGNRTTFTLSADENYSVSSVVGCGGSLTGNTYTTGLVTANCKVEASFAINEYLVQALASEHGSISPTQQTVKHGETAEFTLSPLPGYQVDTVQGCGGVLTGDKYTTGAVTSACSVTASFVKRVYTINAVSNLPASIIPTSLSLAYNETGGIHAAPTDNDDFELFDAVGCPGRLSRQLYYFYLDPTTQDCTLTFLIRKRMKVPNVFPEATRTGIKINWEAQDDDIQFDVFVALESGLTPENYAQKLGGQKFTNAQSGFEISVQDKSQSYYIVVTATRLGEEGTLISPEQRAKMLPVFKYNDSGLTTCSDYPQNNEYVWNKSDWQLDCNQTHDHEGDPIPDGQDADFGRDKLAKLGQLTKVGSGNAGFDFTKLDAQGNPLPADAQNWSCVKDNHMGLIWEVKTTDGGLRDKDNTYTWFNPDPSVHGGEDGTINGGICSGSECDTYRFVNAVNQVGLCGIKQWRLPSKFELHSILDVSLSPAMLDKTFFPNITEPQRWKSNLLKYWTGDTYYENESEDRYKAWTVDFEVSEGIDEDMYKREKLRVRLVTEAK